jgi:hypothetical protein
MCPHEHGVSKAPPTTRRVDEVLAERPDRGEIDETELGSSADPARLG